MEKAAQAQELVEEMKRRLENPNLYLSIRYRQNSITHLNYLLKSGLKVKERENSDQTFHFGALETELNQLKLELENENEEASHLSRNVEILMDDLQSELAAAEARTGSQLSVEAEAAERENQSLKGSDKATEESEDFGSFTLMNMKKSVKRRSQNDGNITISLEEYESLNRKAARDDEFIRRSEPSNMSITSENTYEIQILKKELGIATVKNGEMRARSEQAATRAEKAKTISKINERGVKNKRRG
uniref:Uncharacterized protein n=1 Tax=Salix viminalis TaxID=40686 RepID=A0A6N2LG08_SALVM